MPWLTPSNIPDDVICRPLFIPNSAEWQAIVSGTILELTRSWNWEQFGELTPEECATRMQELQQQYYDDVCGGGDCPPVFRIGSSGNTEQLIDDVWTAPAGDYALPPTPPRGESTAHERRCLAAANAANVLALLYEQATDDFQAALDENTAAVNFAALLGGLLLFPGYGLIAIGLIGLAKLVWTVAYEVLQFVGSDFWTSEFTEQLRCMLFDSSVDVGGGVVHFDYDLFMRKLAAGTEITPDLYSLRLFGQITYLMQFIGSQGLDAAGATTAIDDAVCDCTVCSVTYNDPLIAGIGSRTIILNQSPNTTIFQSLAGHAVGGGQLTSNFVSGAGWQTRVRFDLGQDCEVQEVHGWFRKYALGGFNALFMRLYSEAGTLVFNGTFTLSNVTGWQEYYRIIGLGVGRYVEFIGQTATSQHAISDFTIVTA